MILLTRRNALIAGAYALLAAGLTCAQRDGEARDAESSESSMWLSSDSSNSTSKKSEEFAPWEKHGGFMLYFAIMAYIFIGFEVCHTAHNAAAAAPAAAHKTPREKTA